jgi:hypothetical protein
LTVEEAGDKLKKYSASVAESIKTATHDAIGKDFLDTVQKNLDMALSGASVGYTATVTAITDAQKKLDDAYAKGTITQAQYTAATLSNEDKMKKAREGVLNAINQSATAVGQLATAFGEESDAGRALIKVQQGLALASTALALADSIAGLGKDLKKGFPANVVAVASTLSLIAVAFGQAKALFSRQVGPSDNAASSEQPRKLADGGYVEGPGTGTSDSIPAMLSNGESIINARSTAMFAPLLSAINQSGGGKGFEFGGIATSSIDKSNPFGSEASDILSESVPVKAYVVATDMTSQQMLDRNIKMRSTL